jgi:hypothetical protein
MSFVALVGVVLTETRVLLDRWFLLVLLVLLLLLLGVVDEDFLVRPAALLLRLLTLDASPLFPNNDSPSCELLNKLLRVAMPRGLRRGLLRTMLLLLLLVEEEEEEEI